MHLWLTCTFSGSFFKTMNTTPIEERVEQAWAGSPLYLKKSLLLDTKYLYFFSLAYLVVNILEYFHNTHTRIFWAEYKTCVGNVIQ